MGNKSSTNRANKAPKREQNSKVGKDEEPLMKPNCNNTKCAQTDETRPQEDTRDELQKYRERFIRSLSNLDDIDAGVMKISPEDYDFPFENLVFEGGGNKGLAYVGFVQYLEEHNLRKQIKRIGGASAGAITAALFALGYSSKDIYDFLASNIEEVFLDHNCGYLSLLPNLLKNFGWNPGKKIHRWFGDKIKRMSAANDPNMTFYDLYKEKNIELCVVVTNLNQRRADYCHPKTTPDMPIRDALRMSMAIPGVFAAWEYDHHGQKDIFVDGGVLCNYPIHCYDGWYLSMKREDAFLLRLQPLKKLSNLMAASNRFGTRNHKTIGCLLFDDSEMEVMRYNLESRIGTKAPAAPTRETKLYKEKKRKKEQAEQAEKEHNKVVRAVEAFMKVLDKHNLKEYEFIDKEELRSALEDTENFPKEQAELLFGTGVDVDKAFQTLDKDGNGKVAFQELVQFIEEHGIRWQTRFTGYGRRNIKTFSQFLSALQGTLLTNVKYIYVKEPEDEERTIGINTGHVGTSDYNLEDEDRDFVVKRGYNATDTFLRYYINRFPEYVTRKPKIMGALATAISEALASDPNILGEIEEVCNGHEYAQMIEEKESGLVSQNAEPGIVMSDLLASQTDT